MSITEQRQSVVIDGVKLEIVATQMGKDEWQLTIVNPLGVGCTWIESFSSAEHAMTAGLNAIKSEGVEAFTDDEGFEYLRDGYDT